MCSNKTLSILAAFAVLWSTTLFPTMAQAKLVETEELLAVVEQTDDRQTVDAFLQRTEIEQQFKAWGIPSNEINQRVASLTDQEIAKLARDIEDLPAGQGVGSVVGAVVLVFLVLLATDILGFTKIFPFTRSVR